MQFVVANHDAGWASLDAEAPQSPETGLAVQPDRHSLVSDHLHLRGIASV